MTPMSYIVTAMVILLLIIIFIYRENEWVWAAVLIGLSSLLGLYKGIDIRFIILWNLILAIFYVYFRRLAILDFIRVLGLSILFMVITFSLFIITTYPFHYDPGTSIEIRKYDIQGYDYVSNITLEELSRYPELEKMLNGEDCTIHQGYSNCKVNPEEWNKIREFLNSKSIRDRSGRGTCYKFGEKYGEKCFMFGFVTP